ncbi:unnamed protein product [Protopolystoma xenopodis]|uniref:Cyclic nucleotide-binding domain-containing protein n=1 Tax=Protopolystoma xenopodis TaxID=117903 RepID=A0A3S5AIK3_9PLAT|nr:unnamed protein product [Protopolystoma xenopodis]
MLTSTWEISVSAARQQIRDSLRSNDFLSNLDAVQLQEMVSCMYEKHVPEGAYIIREGDIGHELYVGAGNIFPLIVYQIASIFLSIEGMGYKLGPG